MTRDTSKMRVRASQCKTCVFKREDEGGIELREGRREEIKQNLLKGINQVCHHGNKSICRGGRDYQLVMFHRLGYIEAPTDEALAKKIEEATRGKESGSAE